MPRYGADFTAILTSPLGTLEVCVWDLRVLPASAAMSEVLATLLRPEFGWIAPTQEERHFVRKYQTKGGKEYYFAGLENTAWLLANHQEGSNVTIHYGEFDPAARAAYAIVYGIGIEEGRVKQAKDDRNLEQRFIRLRNAIYDEFHHPEGNILVSE
jgi:hypothetical protein